MGCVWTAAALWAAGAAEAATVTWKSAVSGNWSDGTKWSTGAPPAAGDTAIIDVAGTYTVTVNTTATVAGLTVNAATGRATVAVSGGVLAINGPGVFGGGGALNLVPGGTLGGSGDVTVQRFNWSGGQVEGAGKLIFDSGATVDFVDGGQHTLRDRRIVNRATVNWPTVNGFLVGFGAVWDNEASGVVDLTKDAQVVYWGGVVPVFNNAGVLRKTGGAGQGYFDWNVVNSGSVQQNSGTLNLRQGGTLGASWSVGTGATLALAGGTFATHASTSLGGAGRYQVAGGTLNTAVTHSTGVFVELAPGGTIQGSADLTLAGKFVWSGGQVEGAGKLIFDSGATVDFVDGSQHTLRDRRIVNRTTVNWPTVNGFLVGFGTVWDNEASGVVDLTKDAQAVYWGGTVPVFNNAGVLRKTGGAGQGYFDWSIVNSGSVQQNSGTLNLRQGGTLSSSWSVGTGATLALAGGTFATHASTSLSGAGRYQVAGGTLNSAVAHSTGVFVELAPGGTIQGSADLTLAGKFVWSGGQVEGTGKLIFPVGATVDFVDGSQHTLRDRRIVNRTTVNWPTVNGFLVGFGTVWDNEATGVVDLTKDAQVVYWGGTVPVFNNAGVLRKTGGAGQGYFDWTIVNSGSVQQNSGTLNLRQGGTLGASWSVGTGATLALAGGTFATHASTSLSGAGRYQVAGGTLNSAVAHSTGVFVELAPGGTIQGSADLTLAGKFVWSGGQVEGTGKLIFPVGATVDFVDGSQHTLRDRRIVNRTTVNWPTVNGFLVGFGTVWDNEAAGVVDLTKDAQVVYWGGVVPVFNNAGVLRKTGGTGQGYFDWTIVNSGSVQQNSGTLNLRQGGTLSSSWSVGTGATLALAGGTFATHASTSLAGAGRYQVAGGTLNTTVAHSTGVFVELAPGGTIQGSADLTLAGKFVWSGGQVEGAGKLILPAGATVDFVDGGQHTLRDRRIVNATTVNWPTVNGFLVGFGTVWDNEAAGVVDLTKDAQVVYWGGVVPVFNNAGVLRKTGGTAQAYFDFGFRNTGTVRLEKGTLNFRQGLQQTAGSLELAGGNYEGGPALLDIRGGVLSGAGTIGTGVSLAGELRPGNPLGKLQSAPNWNVTNTPTSVSVIQLGGTQAGVTYDQYFTGGSLNLGGELRIEFANGFEPSGADVFEIMRGAQRKGTFSATNAPAGFLAEVNYSTTNVTLRLTKTAVVAPEITDQPDSLTVLDGQSASFTVGATGSGLTYEWRRNGSPIPGATGPTFTIPAAKFSDEGQYTVVVANAGGSRTSAAAVLTVNPTSLESGLIARYPLDSDVLDAIGNAEGTIIGTTNFVAAGARGGAFRFTGGSYIRLGANPALPIVDPAHAFSASFWIRPRQQKEMVPVRLATPEGEFALYLSSGNNGDFSTHFGFRGFASPATTDARSYVGSFLGCWTHVTVVYKGGAKDLNSSFALFTNGEEMALNARQTIGGGLGENTLGTNIGGANGWVNGDLDEVRIYGRALRPQDAVELAQDAPDCTIEILTQPVDVAVNPGGTATFTVSAIGAQPVTYQWWKDDVRLEGAVTPGIVIGNAQLANAGFYRVVLSNSFGSVTSAPAALSINTLPPVITSQPAEVSVYAGEPASFTVVAVGTGMSYQWRKDGVAIPGATSPTYSIGATAPGDQGTYTVEVRNVAGPTVSFGAPLWVMSAGVDGLLSSYSWDNTIEDGTGTRDLQPLGEPAFRSGPRGTAALMDGFHYFYLGPNLAHPIVDDRRPFAVAFWMRHDLVSSTVPVQLATAGSGFALSMFAPGTAGGASAQVAFGARRQRLVTTDSRALVTSQQGCWVHVAFQYQGGATDDPANSRLFINGQPVVLQNAGQDGPGTHGVCKLGGSNNALEPVVWGGMDELRIYRRALAPTEIAELSQGVPQCPPEITSSPGPTGAVQLGGILNLSVNAIGRPPLVYQWFRNGAAIAGATNANYQAIATVDVGGTYRVEVSNPEGTTPSGNTAITVTLPAPAGLANVSLGIPNYISGASFINAYAGCVSFRGFGGGGGGVCITANGGRTWTVSNVGVTNDINAIQLVGGVGYIAGSSGLLCISTNGGASWNSFVTGTTASFNGLTFLNTTYGFAVGSGGTICIYNGRTWAPTPADAGVDFYGAAFAGDVAWAVGSGGAICRYVGGSWVPWATGTSVNFYGVSFLNPNFGFAVGAGGTICRWNGTTWVALNSGTTGTFRSVVIVDANTAYVAGDNGLLCITRDGGNTWEPLGTGGNGSYGSLALSGGQAFVFGAGGTGFAFSVPNQVLNQPPTIRIVNPTNTQQFYACFRMNVSALASDPDGSITNVTFYRGQFKLAEISTPPRPGQPYRTSFYTDTFGEYVLTAVATDNRGSVTVSDPVTVSVVPPPQDTAVAEAFTDEAGCILCFMGQIGGDYVLQGTLDLNPPIEWVNLSTNTVPEPLLRVNDLDALNHPYRFYRFVPFK